MHAVGQLCTSIVECHIQYHRSPLAKVTGDQALSNGSLRPKSDRLDKLRDTQADDLQATAIMLVGSS
jgi:hypothetical protein